MKPNKYQETFKTWNKVAQLYEDKFMDLELYNGSYDLFCEATGRVEPSILEIGCGPGNITRYILSQIPKGSITAIDVSENMIQLAKKNNPSADFQIMDCRSIDQIKTKFDGLICGFIIPYLAEKDCQKLIADCNELLNEEGVLYLSFVEGDQKDSGYISGSTGDRVYFYYHNLEKIKMTLEKNRLLVQNIVHLDYEKSEDTKEVHTVIIATKN